MSATQGDGEAPAKVTDPGERMDNTEREVLFLLFRDPYPWTVEELGRELGDVGDAADAVTSLAAAGLMHRFPAVARRDDAGHEFVIPSRAARRSDELHDHSL